MTTTTDAEQGPGGTPRDHWTHIGGATQGAGRWYRHTWTIDDARAGLLDSFLTADPDDRDGWMGQDMSVVDQDGQTVAVLVDPERVTRWREAAAQINRLKEQPENPGLSVGIHGPHTGGDQLLIDTEPILEALRHALKRLGVEAPDQDRLLGEAVLVAASVVLPPDERDVVPVRAWRSRSDAAEQEAFWKLAYTTPARGLFVCAGAPNLWGEDFNVVSGSGYRIRSGFASREIATDFAVALAAAVPGIDWRIWDTTRDDMTPDIRDALSKVYAAWGAWGEKNAPAAESEPAKAEA